ncbi:aminoglycoside phosphotransferase family protein [Parapedomonas caeni]
MPLPANVASFLAAYDWHGAAMVPLAGDASHRRYVRLTRGDESAVLMIAPPDKEAVEPFVAIGRHLATLGLSVPAIIGADVDAGLVLLEDLGDRLFAQAISEGFDEAELYAAATDVLARVHAAPVPDRLPGVDVEHRLPVFTDERMTREVDLVLEWYLPTVSGTGVPEDVAAACRAAWAAVWPLARAGEPVLVQFDYHSPNLMWLPGREGLRRVGVLDFQDSLRGPAAYDLVSLIQDPRRDVPAAFEAKLMDRYLAARPTLDRDAFVTSYAVLGAQRAARILGVFVRLWQRDGKPGYLRHQPRVWSLLERNLHHPALAPVKAWFDTHLPAPQRAARWNDPA